MKKEDLINRNIILATENQVKFQSYLGTTVYEWEINIKKNTLIIKTPKGKKLYFKIQLLGTESKADKTWMWAWANTQLRDIPEITEIARSMHDFSLEEGIGEFMEPVISLVDESYPYVIGFISCKLFDGTAFFRAEVDGGALGLIITDPIDYPDKETSTDLIIRSIHKAVKYFNFDIKIGIETYLSYHGYKIEELSKQRFIAKNESSSASIVYSLENNKLVELGDFRGESMPDKLIPHQ